MVSLLIQTAIIAFLLLEPPTVRSYKDCILFDKPCNITSDCCDSQHKCRKIIDRKEYLCWPRPWWITVFETTIAPAPPCLAVPTASITKSPASIAKSTASIAKSTARPAKSQSRPAAPSPPVTTARSQPRRPKKHKGLTSAWQLI